MSGSNSPHRIIIAERLRALGRDPGEVSQYRLLQGGISGSYTYRVSLAGAEVVLKATLPESADYVLHRARREAHFYLQLAERVPLRVPRAIAVHEDETQGISLLLEAYEPVEAPNAWSLASYVEAAEEVGRFHAAFWDRTGELAALAWLRPVEPATGQATVSAALASWSRLWEQAQLGAVLTHQRKAQVQGMLIQIGKLDDVIRSLPQTLCHGDCHIGNLLRDQSANLIWADWQEVGIGAGPEDVSFFCQRAASEGGAVPRDVVIAAYHQSLSAAIGQDVPRATIRQVVGASELRTRLLYWPAYWVDASEEQLEVELLNIEGLARSLDLLPHSPVDN